MTSEAVSWKQPFERQSSYLRILALAAPGAALTAGVLSALSDFRALREPILLAMTLGVAVTAYAVTRGRSTRRAFLFALAAGPAAWAAAQIVYVTIQLLRGEPFEADRFGPQWAQALGLIAAHALFLGAPTGVAAGLLLAGWRRLFDAGHR